MPPCSTSLEGGRMKRRSWNAGGVTLLLLLLMLQCADANAGVLPAAPTLSTDVDDMNLVFVTEDLRIGARGCDSITIFDLSLIHISEPTRPY